MKRLWLFLFLALAVNAHATLTFINAQGYTSTSGTYVVGTEANGVLFAWAGDLGTPPTGMTWNGHAMTQIYQQVYSNSNWFGMTLYEYPLGTALGTSGTLTITGGGDTFTQVQAAEWGGESQTLESNIVASTAKQAPMVSGTITIGNSTSMLGAFISGYLQNINAFDGSPYFNSLTQGLFNNGNSLRQYFYYGGPLIGGNQQISSEWAGSTPATIYGCTILVELHAAGAPVSTATATPTDTPTSTITVSPTITRTFTASPTPWETPTPAATVGFCATLTPSTPFPNAFIQNPVAVLTASGSGYEQGFVGEPCVFLLPDGVTWAMTYSCNAFGDGPAGSNHKVIGESTGPSPVGPWTNFSPVTWTAAPVLGTYAGVNWGGGVGDFGQNTVHTSGSTYIMESGALYATCTDGLHWVFQGTYINSLIYTPQCVDPTSAQVSSGGSIMPYNGGYAQMMEVDAGGCTSPITDMAYQPYVLWLWTNLTNDTTDSGWSIATLVPQASISPLTDLYAGGRAFRYDAATQTYHGWPHIAYPDLSDIYHTSSYDLHNWYTDPVPVVTPQAAMFGLSNCNQAADTCGPIDYRGNLYLIYDGTDNANHGGAIGYSEFHGTFAEYASCSLPAPTPTPTPQTLQGSPYELNFINDFSQPQYIFRSSQ